MKNINDNRPKWCINCVYWSAFPTKRDYGKCKNAITVRDSGYIHNNSTYVIDYSEQPAADLLTHKNHCCSCFITKE